METKNSLVDSVDLLCPTYPEAYENVPQTTPITMLTIKANNFLHIHDTSNNYIYTITIIMYYCYSIITQDLKLNYTFKSYYLLYFIHMNFIWEQTIIMHIKKIILIVFIFFGLSVLSNSSLKTYAFDINNIDAKSYILIDQKTGQVLVELNSTQKLYPASTTKILTGVVALENAELNQTMKASECAVNSVGPDGMNIGIMASEEIPFEELLNGLLVKSANETAYIIAENISGTYQNFCAMMNKKAFEIGATDTHFVNPCGMDTEAYQIDHLTTASDLAKIAKYAMDNTKFREIVCKKNCVINPTNKHSDPITLQSTNKLLFQNYSSKYYRKITGIKTGYTNKAGHNLVASAINDNGMEIISVIMGVKDCPSNNVFIYSKILLEYGFENFSLQTLIDPTEKIQEIAIPYAKDENIKLVIIPSNESKSILPIDKTKWNLERTVFIKKSIIAPIKKDEILGYLEYKRNNKVIGKVNLIASTDIPEKTMHKVSKITQQFFSIKNILIVCGIIAVLLCILEIIKLNSIG